MGPFRGRARFGRAGAALLLVVCRGVAATADLTKYLIATQPDQAKVVYTQLWTFDELALPSSQRPVLTPRTLIDGVTSACQGGVTVCDETSDQGLRRPDAVAVFHAAAGSVLYVADVQAEKLFAYDLSVSGVIDVLSPLAPSLRVGAQRVIRQDITGGVKGVAVDGMGNVFFSSANQVSMIRADQLHRGREAPAVVLYQGADATTAAAAAAAAAAPATPALLLQTGRARRLQQPAPAAVAPAADPAAVTAPTGSPSSPGALVVDNFFVYWVNGAEGTTDGVGTIVKGYERERPHGAGIPSGYPMNLAMNSPTASGICLARDNVFYTVPQATALPMVYGVKTNAGAIAEITRGVTDPRGCAWDGDGAIYVADHGANAIISMPSAFGSLRTVEQTERIMEVIGPGQLAVYLPSSGAAGSGAALILAVFAVLFSV